MSGGFDQKPGASRASVSPAPHSPEPGKATLTAPALPRTTSEASVQAGTVERYDEMLAAVMAAKRIAHQTSPDDREAHAQILKLIEPVERRLGQLNDHQGRLARFGAGNVAGQAALDVSEAAIRSWRQLLLLGGMVRTGEIVMRFQMGAEVIQFLTGEHRDAPTLREFNRVSTGVGLAAAAPVLAPPLAALAITEAPLLSFAVRISARRVGLWAATQPTAALALSEVLLGLGLQIGEGGWEPFWSPLQDPQGRWFVIAQVLMDYMHVRGSVGVEPGPRSGRGAGKGEVDIEGARARVTKARSTLRRVHDAVESDPIAPTSPFRSDRDGHATERRPGPPTNEASEGPAPSGSAVSESKKSSQELFIEGADPASIRGKRIKPGHLRRELMKSEVGKETLEIIERDDIKVILSYNAPTLERAGETLYGISYGDRAVIYVTRTQSTQQTAQTVIHEVTHNAGVKGSQRAEIIAEIRATKHLGPISVADIKKIILRIKKDYPELPYKIISEQPGPP